ncbi:MAG: HAD-IIIA family hydrolase [Nitrospiraceae bacterium]|nr:HAD-IIIA family hydrolase [Nitrospiraceae bacterium]
MKKKSKSEKQTVNIKKTAKNAKLLILDVDGVMTDGRIILDNDGNEFKAFHVRDGHGIRMLMRAGIQVAIITGRQSKVVDRRAKELGITEVYQNYFKKLDAYEIIKNKFSLRDAEIICIADDVVDLPLIRRAGLSFAVADAPEDVRANATIVTKNDGGRGAVREAVDFILKAKNLWNGIIDEYLEA